MSSADKFSTCEIYQVTTVPQQKAEEDDSGSLSGR